jgi:hypothetical protein
LLFLLSLTVFLLLLPVFELLIGLELRLGFEILGQFFSLLGHHLSLLLLKLLVMLPETVIVVTHRGGVLWLSLSLFGRLCVLGRRDSGLLEDRFFCLGGLDRGELGGLGLLSRFLNNRPEFFGIAMRGNHMSILGLFMVNLSGKRASMGVEFNRLFLRGMTSSVPAVSVPFGLGVGLRRGLWRRFGGFRIMAALVVLGSVTIVMMLFRSRMVARVRVFIIMLLNTLVVVVGVFFTVVAAVVIVMMLDILPLVVIKLLVFAAIFSLVTATATTGVTLWVSLGISLRISWISLRLTLGVLLVLSGHIEAKAILKIPLDLQVLLMRVLWLHL